MTDDSAAAAAFDDDALSASERSLLATYESSTYTYYTTLTPGTVGCGVDSADASPETIKARILYATATVGRNIDAPAGKDSTGLLVWPATHLLSQYLAYSVIAAPPSEAVKRFSVKYAGGGGGIGGGSIGGGGGGSKFPPLGNRILELGCGAGLCGIVAALALARKNREANDELAMAAAVIDFDKIDLDAMSDSSDEEDGVEEGEDDLESLGSPGKGGGGRTEPVSDGEVVVVCTDADPDVVELCRENVTRDLFFRDEDDMTEAATTGAEDDQGGLGIDDEDAAALAKLAHAAAEACGGGPGTVIAPPGQRQSSDHPLANHLESHNTSYSYLGAEVSDEDIVGSRHHNLDDNSGTGIPPPEAGVRVLARTLRWGDVRAGRDIMKQATAATSNLFSATDLDEDFRASMCVLGRATSTSRDDKFHTVMAADVIHPTTSDDALRRLFKTVDQCLKVDGVFLLSFVERDGHRTPLRLLTAASEAGFKVDCIPEKEFVPRSSSGESMLPPTMDAKLLVLIKDEDAADFNGLLGEDSCRIFPGLKTKAERAAN